jgi:Asp-tRNA(Asn)/Glu-tRNA(Gln) amidotransferase A subunit family amidase
MAEWKGTNGTSEDPKSAFSDPPVRNRKNRILGGLGVMAVQSCSRIRVSVNCGFTRSGPPIGLQILGKPFDEATVLRVAHAYEQATTWHMERPRL